MRNMLLTLLLPLVWLGNLTSVDAAEARFTAAADAPRLFGCFRADITCTEFTNFHGYQPPNQSRALANS